MWAILFWVLIVGFSFVLELHSNAFIAVFIGFGAAISFVLALASLPFTFQASPVRDAPVSPPRRRDQHVATH
jgi:hypothetical protein